MFRSLFIILGGNALSAVFLLARNLIIARLIPVEDYGIAATFAVAMAVVEMMSTLGLQQQIVQSRQGDDPHFQAVLQGFQVLRGVISAAAMMLIAVPLAHLLGIPEVAWAYQLLALIPMLNALAHFDIYRLNRRMIYLPSILSNTLPALVSLLAIWPLFALFDDWRLMLYAILAQSILFVVTSHIMAERPYRLTLDRGIMAASLRFGWPLLVNSVALFFLFNGEKLIVGRELGMVPLAIFAMGLTLTLTPTMVAEMSTQRFFLPQLSAAAAATDTPETDERFRHLALASIETGILTGALLVLGVLLLGEPVVDLLLGAKYAALVPLLPWLAILQATRLFKTSGSIMALSRGQTSNALIANIVRITGLPVAWFVLHTGGDLLDVIWIAIASEICGFAASLLLIRYRLKLSLRPLAAPLAITLVFIMSAVPGVVRVDPLPGWMSDLPAVVLFVLLVVSMRNLRRYFRRRIVTTFAE